jgi:hypothetical protein
MIGEIVAGITNRRNQRYAHQALVPMLAREVEDMPAREVKNRLAQEVEDKLSVSPDMCSHHCRRAAPHTSFGSAAKTTELRRWVHSPGLRSLKGP